MKKILIVEDDILLNRTLGYNLTSDGYDVTSAYNYKGAVQHLRKKEFDIALLDINLPEGSGLDLCEEIRGHGQHTYIIFITANDKESDMLKGYEAGGADYVTKPFSVMVLCKKVAAIFANMELRAPQHDLFDDGFLKIDFSEQSASLAGKPLDFTPKEYRALFLFACNHYRSGYLPDGNHFFRLGERCFESSESGPVPRYVPSGKRRYQNNIPIGQRF